jgi:predicted Zn-dependent peptidase
VIKILGPLLTLLLAGSGPLHADELGQSVLGLKQEIKHVTLENGLHLILVRRPFSPTVAAYIKFRAGGVDETDESAGIAHMLEHMLFKGTPTIGTIDFEKEEKYILQANAFAAHLDRARRSLEQAKAANDTQAIERLTKEVQLRRSRLMSLNRFSRRFIVPDADSYIYALNGERGYNAYTSKDLTNYQVELPASRLEVWARLESDRLQNSVLRDFYTEREVVVEERRLRVDNVAQGFLLESFIKAVYGKHPYGRSLIGTMDVIQYLNYDQAMAFYRTYYAPNNTVIALVGDIDLAASESLVRKYFSALKPAVIPPTNPAPAEIKPVHIEVARPGSPLMFMAWHTPSGLTKENMALEVLSGILAGKKDSRLFTSLVLKERTAAEISAFTGYPGERYPGLLTISAVPAPGKTYEDVQKGVLEEIGKIQKDGVTQDEVDRIKTGSLADFLYGLRSNASYADNLTYYQLIYGNYNRLFDRIELLNQITREDVQKAAVDLLKPELLSTARLKAVPQSSQEKESP